jgi:hypothetical protein
VRKFIVIAVLSAIGAAVAATSAVAAVPTGNLLVNAGAEAPPALEASGDYGSPQGWTPTVTPEDGEQGPFDSCYGGADGETEALESSVGAAIDGGARYFFAGYDELVTLRQEVQVTPEADGRTLLIGGDFGGWEGQEDHASLEARFFNSDGSVEFGPPVATSPVTVADRDYETTMLPREARGTVPTGATMIRFVLTQTREEGLSNDGYADNLYATFDPAMPARPVPQGDPACPLVQAVVPPVVQPVAPAGSPAPTPPPTPPRPTVAITGGPGHETAKSAAVFEFAGTPGGTYECTVDGAPWRTCVSGRDFGPARPGDHVFEVREKLNGATSPAARYRWTVDLPKQCVLRVARARVFVFARREKARLVIHYTTYKPAKVTVSYALRGAAGRLAIGSATARFTTAGVFRLPVRLTKAQTRKARAAKRFAVRFKIPETPKSCGRYYAKQLTIPKRVSGQTVWFQSDSVFGT